MSEKSIYRIQFINGKELYEIYAKEIFQSELYAFIEAEEFVFNTKTTVVVDPSEEKLKDEFADVKRTYIPMHAIIRIDEVTKQGVAKIRAVGDKSNTGRPFSSSVYQMPPKNQGE